MKLLQATPIMVLFSTCFLLGSHVSISQDNEDLHLWTVKENGDTTIFELREHELDLYEVETQLRLNHKVKRRSRKIEEYSSGEIKFFGNDTLYWVRLDEFFDSYVIALIARLEVTQESEELVNFEFKRVAYEEIELLTTSGKSDYSWIRSTLGVTAFTEGLGLAALSIFNNPALIPVGLGTSLLAYLYLRPIMNKDYQFAEWEYEVKVKEGQ